jgi:integral membrane protein (TIGR01906 family)
VTLYRAEVVVFAIAFAVCGLVALALIWSGDWAYALLANLDGVKQMAFILRASLVDPRSVETPIDLPTAISWHHMWSAYVTGASAQPAISFGLPVFSQDEYGHMADVRAVFHGAEVAAVLAFFVAGFRIMRARSQGYALRLVRAGSLIAAGIVTVIGVAAAVAFEPLFLLFHDVFFPQGNFLFDPASSNLIRLYPEWYWQGITAGVGLSFIAVAVLVAGAAHIALRRRSNTYTRAA